MRSRPSLLACAPKMQIQRIVTHHGGAHKDDLLACCVLAAKHGCPIVRRDPTPEELADVTVATVDIGGSHDPAQNNFDHHHFPREHPPTCSLSLVLDALGVYQDALQFCDWLEPAEWFDSRGPNRTAEWLGVPRRAVSQMGSPIDATLLRRFAAQPEHRPGETLYEYMRFVGQDLLDFLREVRESIDLVTRTSQRWSVTAGSEVIETVFLPRGSDGDALPDEPSGSVARYIRAKGLEKVIGRAWLLVLVEEASPEQPSPPFQPCVRFSRTRLTDGLVHAVLLPGYWMVPSNLCRPRARSLSSGHARRWCATRQASRWP